MSLASLGRMLSACATEDGSAGEAEVTRAFDSLPRMKFGLALARHSIDMHIRFHLSMTSLHARRNYIVGISSNLTLAFYAYQQLKRIHVMMQTNEITQRFSQVENTIHQAAQRCQSASSVPTDLKDCIQQLDQKTTQARQTMQSQDQNRIRQCVDDLEQLGDRAKDACEHASNLDGELKNAVMQAHSELSNLKHQLH